jgi:CxxC-x17-CxxC domain-containing protein
MKKNIKVKTDVAEMLDKIQQQLTVLDNKVNILIAKQAPRPAEAKPFSKPFQQPHTHNQGQTRQDNNYRERVMHKTICADCKKECEVPFKPTGDRPVYCKECFGKRKAASSFKPNFDNRPKDASPAQTMHVNKPQVLEKKKAVEKKKPAAKKRKPKK